MSIAHAQYMGGQTQTALTAAQEFVKKYEGNQGVGIMLMSELYQHGNKSGGAGVSGTDRLQVIWFNDDKEGHTVTSKKGLFDSGSISLNSEYSYFFDKPGVYPYYSKLFPSITNVVRIYDSVTECNIDLGCGGVTNSICKEFGKIDEDGNCLNHDELKKMVQQEMERRHQFMEDRKSELESKKSLLETIRNEQYQPIYLQWIELGKHRYEMDESEYMRQYRELSAKMEPLETQMNMLEDEIRDLEQDNNVKHVCTKSDTNFFTCVTQIKSTNQRWEDLGKSPNAIIAQIEQSQDTPRWILTVFKWYEEGQLTENELLQLVKWLISNKIIAVN